jgi:hypothetical protein
MLQKPQQLSLEKVLPKTGEKRGQAHLDQILFFRNHHNPLQWMAEHEGACATTISVRTHSLLAMVCFTE